MKRISTKLAKSFTNKLIIGSTGQTALLYLFLTLLVTSISCKKEPDDNNPDIPVEVPESRAVYVLNQGS